MTQKDIETLSVSAVRDSIVISDFLDQFISDNDKEPSWDGHVYIYDNKSKKKDTLRGRVPVQVKGTENNDFSNKEINYPISIADLKNYLYDGGIIIFVVYIRVNDLQKKIYYAELSPIILRRILAEAENKKTKSIQFKEFPSDGNTKASLFLNFYLNSQKQSSFVNAKLFSIEELEKQGVFQGISVYASGYGLPNNDPAYAFLNSQVYLYANIKGSSIPQPLEEIPVEIHIAGQEKHIISVGAIVYYDTFKRIRNKNDVTIKIGESFFIILKKEGEKIIQTIKFSFSEKLFSFIKDLNFFIALLDVGCFKIDGYEITINTEEFYSSGFDIVKAKERLNFFEKVGQVFNQFGIKDDVNIDYLSNHDLKNINLLIQAFIDKKPVSGLGESLSPFITIDVADYRFALVFEYYSGLPDTYTILDFFKTEIKLRAKDENGVEHEVPSCAILIPEDYLNISNIRFDSLLPSYQKIDNPYSRERANWTLLDLLSAYDMSNASRPELLRTAKDFAVWLSEVGDDALPHEISRLNLLQTIKREREFTIDEIKELCTITEGSKAQREDILVGAHLLLGNQAAAEIHFSKCEPILQEAFKKYPIYHFWKAE